MGKLHNTAPPLFRKEKTVQLKSLHLYYDKYARNADKIGAYECSIEFQNSTVDQKLRLGEEVSMKILRIIADEIIAASKTLANEIQPAIEAAYKPKTLEGPKDDS